MPVTSIKQWNGESMMPTRWERNSFRSKMLSDSLTWLESGTCRETSQTIIEFSLTLLLETSLEEINCFPLMANSTSRIEPRLRIYSWTTLLVLISHNLRWPFAPPERKRLQLSGWNFMTPTTWSSLKTWVSIPFSISTNLDEQSYPQESTDNPCCDHLTSFTAALWKLNTRAFFWSLLHTFHIQIVWSIPAEARRWAVD